LSFSAIGVGTLVASVSLSPASRLITGARLYCTPRWPNDNRRAIERAYADGAERQTRRSTENNGTRLYGFDGAGKIIPQPLANTPIFHRDTSTQF